MSFIMVGLLGNGGFGNSKVGNFLNKVGTSLFEEDQTPWGGGSNSNRTGHRKSTQPEKVDVTTKEYGQAYSVKEAPAALTVSPLFSKDNGNNLAQNWPNSDEGRLPYSLFNRYALYNFRGFYGGYAPSLTDYYTDVNNASSKFRGPELRGFNIHDISEKKIIEYYNENFPRLAYSPTDFLYNKYFQEIPVNHLITVRRFAMPCEDNIFDLTEKYLATCTATTYLGEKADNKLEDILKFSGVGVSWKEQKAELQDIHGGSSTKGPGKFDTGLGKVLGATMAGKSAASMYRAENFGSGDPMQRYGSFVLGPVNVIDKTTIRDRGINFKNDFDLNFNYELRSWYMVNPKIAMLDLFSNMLVMATNNGDFWGGGWRCSGGVSQSKITDLYGDRSKLRKGDFIGYAQSVVTDVVHGNKSKGIKGITGLFGDGSGSFSFKSIIGGLGDLLQNLLTQKIGNLMDSFSGGQQNPGSDVPKALISGEPTGYWHIVVGNPMNPIALMGDMICKDNEFILGGGLGYDDFPMEFKVKLHFEHSKPRDREMIENMFNGAHGRLYAAPADDILNVAGKEVQEYGVMPTGPGMHTNIKEVAKKVDMTKEHVANIIALNIKE